MYNLATQFQVFTDEDSDSYFKNKIVVRVPYNILKKNEHILINMSCVS